MYPWDKFSAKPAFKSVQPSFWVRFRRCAFAWADFRFFMSSPTASPYCRHLPGLWRVSQADAARRRHSGYFPVLGAICFTVGMFWGAKKGSVPAWLGMSFSFTLGTVVVWVCFTHGATWALSFAGSPTCRWPWCCSSSSFGASLPACCSASWDSWPGRCLSPRCSRSFTHHPGLQLPRASSRHHGQGGCGHGHDPAGAGGRAGRQPGRPGARTPRAPSSWRPTPSSFCLAAAWRISITREPKSARRWSAHSRFAQAALLLYSAWALSPGRVCRSRRGHRPGRSTSWPPAFPSPAFSLPAPSRPRSEQSQALRLDLTPWLCPGDDLKRLRFTSVLAVPMIGRSVTEGALLLAGMRAPQRRRLPARLPMPCAPTICCPSRCSPPACRPRAARP